jgi:acetyl-CoA acetyltransferase
MTADQLAAIKVPEGYVLVRASASIRPRYKTADFAAEYAHFRSYGLTRNRIAERLGITRSAVDQAYVRAVRAGLLTPDRRPA